MRLLTPSPRVEGVQKLGKRRGAELRRDVSFWVLPSTTGPTLAGYLQHQQLGRHVSAHSILGFGEKEGRKRWMSTLCRMEPMSSQPLTRDNPTLSLCFLRRWWSLSRLTLCDLLHSDRFVFYLVTRFEWRHQTNRCFTMEA